MQLALKVDIDTLRGTLEGVPALLRQLDRHGLRASFLFSLGPDHTGRALRRAFRPGFLGKVRRTSVLQHYGLRTLLYGTLLPGPDIGRRGAAVMRSVRDAGHEVGIHTWDHVRWQDGVADAGADWTRRELRLAAERFAEIFGAPAQLHGAAGWQMNDVAFGELDAMQLRCASDSRGTAPFLPVIGGRTLRCPQLPTTLPTLDELIGRDDLPQPDPVDHLLSLPPVNPLTGHVYTLHAELEGMALAPQFERLLLGWRAQGYVLGTLAATCAALAGVPLPACRILRGSVEGRSGLLAVQGEPLGL
jgi:peptidoglycan/xylan/chitin deacetylase (PgdA/CDA1 family)